MKGAEELRPSFASEQMHRPRAKEIGLPPRPFLYTIDQVASLVEISESSLKKNYIHFDRRSVGIRPKDKMLAVNVAAENDKPDWRIGEAELLRWLQAQGFRFYERLRW